MIRCVAARRSLALLAWLAGPLLVSTTLAQELNVPTPRYAPKTMRAHWLTHPHLSGNEAAVVLFRRTIDLPRQPDRLVVNVSADNKYTLFVNGQKVCFGPQLSDIRHWRYETVDLAPYLRAGRNVVAAEVVNFGPDRFFGMQSHRTAFLMNQPEADADAPFNTTNRNGWRVLHNRALGSKPVRWRVRPQDRDIVGGFYAANPTDSLVAAGYPWGWETPDFDDAGWLPAAFCENASAFGGGFAWLLEPRNVALQTQRVERLTRLANWAGGNATDGFLRGTGPLTVPARSLLTLLIDHAALTIGYPELRFSGGRGAQIRIGYAENLFVPGTPNKVNRNRIDGMQFIGMTDVVMPDGGANRLFRPTWLRTFRFVRLELITQDEPLTIQDFYNVYTYSPYPITASLRTDRPEYAAVFDLCRRTVALCTQDYLLSDAYYETMQYVGDSKVHNLTWLALTGNDRHVRNALEQFHYSRLWDGNLTSCYPLRSTFVHPTYSVIWVDMLWDHYLHAGDKAFLRQFVPGIRQTMAMFDGLIQANGLAGPTRWDYFIDWYRNARSGGLAPGQDGSNSAVVTLHYVYALQNAARIFDALAEPQQATTYRQRANQLRKQVWAACYDARRGLIAERPTKDYFDQHTNIMAVLTDAAPAAQQKAILTNILADTSLGEATYYYRFYLFEAIHKARAGELFGRALQPWKSLVTDGLTTTPERFESATHPTRSECHPWSTAPAYAYFSTLAGIRPAQPGFRQVRMAPDLGEVSWVEGTYAHPAGPLPFRLERSGAAGLKGYVTLPPGVTGTLVWQGKTQPLRSGRQAIKL